MRLISPLLLYQAESKLKQASMSETESFPDWNSLPGITLDGGYELKEILAAQKELAVIRVRVLGDYTLNASATFYLLSRPDAKRQVDSWQLLRTSGGSNLSVPLGSGILTMNGSCLAYLVSQNPEETLAEVIDKRALSAEESIESLRAIARGLETLHEKGLVHGSLAPSEVLAIGDDIKLTTEAVREVNVEPPVEPRKVKYLAPENQKYNLSPAADVWCLGATIFEASTQKTFEPALRDQAEELRHPLGSLIVRCTETDQEKRCKIADLESIIRSKAPLPKPKVSGTAVLEKPTVLPASDKSTVAALPSEPPRPLEANVSTTTSVTSSSAPAEELTSAQAPVMPEPPLARPPAAERPPGAGLEASDNANGRRLRAEPVPRRAAQNTTDAEQPILPAAASSAFRSEAKRFEDEPPGTFSHKRGWLYAIAAFLIIFFVLWLFRGHSTPKTLKPQATPASPTTNSSQSTQPKPAWQTHTLNPDGKSVAPAQTPRPTAPQAASAPSPVNSASAKTTWRVICYTYNRQEDADRKVQDINARKPNLHVQVFRANENGGPYLVVVGGGMSRQEAVRMRSRALREGMPHDTYIQNYKQ